MTEIDQILAAPVNFLADHSGPDGDIVVSSRVRLARNLADLPFPIASTVAERQEILAQVNAAVEQEQALGKRAFLLEMDKLSALDRTFLLERHLISQDLLQKVEQRFVLVSGDQHLAIMVNEEDHLRLQAIAPGFCLGQCYEQSVKLEARLNRHLPYAFSSKLGYLTSCPTNVGTGLRASAMLHLPALTLTGKIDAISKAVNQLNLTMRGRFGENSDFGGALYQFSNQSTLGETELQIIDRLSQILRQIISEERNERNRLAATDQAKLFDQVGRAYGLLRHGYILPASEAADALSKLHLGVDMNMFDQVKMPLINQLFLLTGDAHLQKTLKFKSEDAGELNIRRAAAFRQKLQNP